ncbi:MAG: hypothetical protein AAFP26_05675, partial [Planctomycetota bacterium]
LPRRQTTKAGWCRVDVYRVKNYSTVDALQGEWWHSLGTRYGGSDRFRGVGCWLDESVAWPRTNCGADARLFVTDEEALSQDLIRTSLANSPDAAIDGALHWDMEKLTTTLSLRNLMRSLEQASDLDIVKMSRKVVAAWNPMEQSRISWRQAVSEMLAEHTNPKLLLARFGDLSLQTQNTLGKSQRSYQENVIYEIESRLPRLAVKARLSRETLQGRFGRSVGLASMLLSVLNILLVALGLWISYLVFAT